jgi:hypothetical protein
MQACLCQQGTLPPVAIRISLACEEKAAYTDGTVTRHSEQVVYSQDIWSLLIEDRRHEQLNELFSVQVPPGAVHSFASAHNWITWKLVFQEELLSTGNRWSRDFPVVVVPGAEART